MRLWQKFIFTLGVLCWGAVGVADAYGARPEVKSFIAEMAQKHQFDVASLSTLFNEVTPQEKVLANMQRQAEAKPWYEYRPLFFSGTRVRDGATFWKAHADALQRAEKTYGVPPEIIVAILAVETQYGKNVGNYRVIDALSTLAFDYPARSSYFRKELEQFLLMAREEHLDVRKLKGSFTGAMGAPQFMPSSYRQYAVDFSGTGQRDLWNDWDDVIGSVAHYFAKNGWRPGEAVVIPTQLAKPLADTQYIATRKTLKPKYLGETLASQGIDVPPRLLKTRLSLLALAKDPNTTEYWLGLHNFYVITQYNHSVSYAMAVYQLGDAIRTQYQQAQA